MIVFDLDDTLIDTSGVVVPYKLREIAQFVSLRRNDAGSAQSLYGELAAINRHTLSSKQAVSKFLTLHSALDLHEEIMAIYNAPLPEEFDLPTTPHAKEVLEALSGRHRLAMVTAGARGFQMSKLKKAGFEPSIFSKIAVPEGSDKTPSYEELLNEFLLPPRDIVVVGDRVGIDLAPARALGFLTVHMRWGREAREIAETWIDYSIRELSELLDIV